MAIVLCLGLCFAQNAIAKRSVDEAINWAEEQIGSNWDSECEDYWAYNCWHFCAHTYDMIGTNPVILGSAIEVWNYNGNNYGDRHTDQNIPRGALVFFATTPNNIHGHVGLYVGNGEMIDAWVNGVRRASLSSGGNYLGWRWPIVWTDDSPTNNQVIKFSDSPTCYLVSNNQLWPISNEISYILLGYRLNCVSYTSDWSYVVNLDSSQRGNYDIRDELLPSQNNSSIGKMIAYKVVEKVGPTTCVSMDVDSTRIYLFGADGKFHHIKNEQIYFDLGYRSWDDVVEISPDLFMYYGEGDEINGSYGGGLYEPVNLTAQTASTSQINLFWNRGLNPPEYESLRYRIYRSVNDGEYHAIATTANQYYSDTGLNSSTQYCYKITAYIDSNDESCFSNRSCSRTFAPSPAPSPAPSLPVPTIMSIEEFD